METTPSFVNYLMDSLGFSKQQALSFSPKLSRYRLGQEGGQVSESNAIPKADSVISFLNQHGFDQSHIRHIVLYDPRILRAKIDQTLKPKIEFLREQGLSGPDLVQFVTKNPVVLSLSLNTCTLPAIQALREILGNDEDVIATVNRMHHTSFRRAAKNLVANVALLQSYGIALESIRRRIIRQPSVYVVNVELFKDILVRVEEKWGIPRDSPMFLYGVSLLACLSEDRIDSRCRVFESFGWTKSDVRAIMKQHPNCFLLAEARIKKSLEFLINELGYNPAVIVSRPSLLICSLEKRIIPRHKVLLILKGKGLISTDYPLYRVTCLSEACFVKRFVLPFKEVHVVYEECNGGSLQQLTEEKADLH